MKVTIELELPTLPCTYPIAYDTAEDKYKEERIEALQELLGDMILSDIESAIEFLLATSPHCSLEGASILELHLPELEHPTLRAPCLAPAATSLSDLGHPFINEVEVNKEIGAISSLPKK